MNRLAILAGGLAGSALIAAAGIGVASAAANNSNVGKSDIPRTIFKQDRLEAAASVLNTSTANVQTAKKNKTLDQLIKNAGLNAKDFRQQVKAKLTSELEAAGYSQDQITIVMQHRQIARLHHKLHTIKNNT